MTDLTSIYEATIGKRYNSINEIPLGQFSDPDKFGQEIKTLFPLLIEEINNGFNTVSKSEASTMFNQIQLLARRTKGFDDGYGIPDNVGQNNYNEVVNALT